MPDALYIAQKTPILGMHGQNECHSFAESLPLVRAPAERRRDVVARVVENLARLPERRQRGDENQSKPVSTKSAICSA